MRNDGENLVMLFIRGSFVSLVFGIWFMYIYVYIERIWLTNFQEKVKSKM